MDQPGFDTLAFGYALAEAPRWSPDGALYFSDVIDGGVYRVGESGRIDVVVPRRRRVGGIALHADGGIVVSGRDVSHVRDGRSRTLLRRDGVIFNDLCCDAAGRVLVGAVRADPADPERSIGETLRIDREGEATVLYGDVPIPNGIAFSPDGSRLYHAESAWRQVHVLDLDAAGRIVSRQVLVDLSAGRPPCYTYPSPLPAPDGLAVDAQGGVWVALAGGGRMQRYSSQGEPDIAIEVPAQRPTSLAFGGLDLLDLYVVSSDNREDPARRGTVFRTRSRVPGLPLHPARI